jgi:UDP-2-acetamido-3-amino-2,3-dideoxy-glucuronate N-acetyltransferase
MDFDSVFVHPTAVVDDGAVLGAGTKVWHFSHIMPQAVLGENCNIGQNVVVSPGVRLGNNVKVQNNVSLYTGVVCDDDVFLGPSCVFTNVTNPRSAVNRRDQYAKTHVGKGATIGANVPDYALVLGNPARQVGWMSAYGHRLDFGTNAKATCPESGEVYALEDNRVYPLPR